ncbi:MULTISPECIES: hypothetical protein [Enterobacteriaceae]|uniref:Uncharacterized protein n=1 Tax=Enterobacter hormaechei subsp. hoffmannii TaxID=1812934 RepID=A0A9Q2WC83_9ENTR|nr:MULTISPECIES: hypothetical protein [Enterobacteriaceae]EAO9400989.1 hypothetical protein [Salmonella enterica]ECS8395004.1 hypothetical protein [Salmonella enterica subsp. enterica serovar Derby]EDC4170078.1 hypothetical protein [Salmonella enterica subsp. enterica serovar Tennessee]EDD0545879.1 hypothetical protein [Salmonella enterica subsp. enterica serovar Senftenberg]MBT1777865.1 hypothetical protein [Enterobacter hormaechei subsp. hoffmannii]MDU3899204.1 hypothetical protein [Enterob
MEQLTRLADTIAETYTRDLKRETGGNTVEYNGVSGQVVPHRLSSGLVDNVISAVRDDADKEAAAYKLLLRLIDITGREYRLTERGVLVMESMIRNGLMSSNKRVVH